MLTSTLLSWILLSSSLSPGAAGPAVRPDLAFLCIFEIEDLAWVDSTRAEVDDEGRDGFEDEEEQAYQPLGQSRQVGVPSSRLKPSRPFSPRPTRERRTPARSPPSA